MSIIQSPPNPDPHAAGYSSFVPPGDLACWVRSSASLDTANGNLTINMNLETDSPMAGPIGKTIVHVMDAANSEIASVDMSAPIHIGGKPGWQVSSVKYEMHSTIPAPVAARAASLRAEAVYVGRFNEWHSIPAGFVVEAVTTALKLISGGGGDDPQKQPKKN